MYAISLLLFFVAGKASRVPKATDYFFSIVEWSLKLSWCANRRCTARTAMSIDRGNHRLITGHAKCNFSPSSARCMDPQCEDDCCRLCWFVFWGGKKRKPNMVGKFAKMLIRLKQWSEGNFWRPINVQCVTRVGTLFFLVKLHGEHLPELSPVSPYSKV